MHTDRKKERLPIVHILGSLGGFMGGGIIGTILIALVIMVTDNTLGLNNIWPGTLIGAILGAILGFCSPRIGKTIAEIMNYVR